MLFNFGNQVGKKINDKTYHQEIIRGNTLYIMIIILREKSKEYTFTDKKKNV